MAVRELGNPLALARRPAGVITGPRGEALFAEPGEHEFVVPAGVFQISYVQIQGGAAGAQGSTSPTGARGSGGAGGALIFVSQLEVTPGDVLSLIVSAGGKGALTGANREAPTPTEVRLNGVLVSSAADHGDHPSSKTLPTRADFKFNVAHLSFGGAGNSGTQYGGGGGGGAGGYSGKGGDGGQGAPGAAVSGHAGGAGEPYSGAAGGGGGGSYTSSTGSRFRGGQGGGVGVYGLYPEGGPIVTGSGGPGGVTGTGGIGAPGSAFDAPGYGSVFGGGGGGGAYIGTALAGGDGGDGAIRIVWGLGRQFPASDVGTNK